MGSKNQEAKLGGSQPQAFSVRIVSIDYYMAPPIPGLGISYSPFHGGKVNEVPVIRIYGSTPAGQKTCLHIHRVLPYLYVPCSDLGLITNDDVDAHKHSISLSLEKTLRLKGNAGSKRQHVHGCDIVRAKKFYGYHSPEELFLKIYLYYPHDVPRAADILLTGAILDKTLQPYESHIPFLLQFLIDNHLYGMGHLHVSKVRFRSPIPDVFSHRKVKHQGKVKPLADDSTCMDFQVDLGGDLCLNTPIWISSTVPDGWIWKYSHVADSSTTKKIPFFRRQSTSELEVDAAVQDIINQQFISYAPLSQTHSEVKMVQSLIPIWEEEYERNGVPDVRPLDSEKPLPQDVLKILSDGIDFKNFMEVRTEAGNWSLLTPQSTESSKVCGDLIDSKLADIENSNDLPSKYLKASDSIGSLLFSDSPFQNVDAADTKDIDAADLLQKSVTVGPSTAKVTDEDGLRLLKWLASSQAAEDINSDDELARETILSPLLPSKDIDKVLEIANVGYESESQKECQDILDTVDMLNFEELNNRSFLLAEYNHSSGSLSNNIIPQEDGSSDDLQSTSCQDKLLKIGESEAAKPFAECQSWPELDSSLIGKNRLKRPHWGSLPISHHKVSDVLPPDTPCILNGHDDEGKEVSGTSWLRDELNRFSIVKDDEQKDVSYMEQASLKVDCSTRDLMRRKRSHRIEFSECKSQVKDWKAESYPDTGFCEGDVNPGLKLYNDIEVNNEAIQIKPSSSCFTTIGVSPLSSSEESAEVRNLGKNGNPENAVQVDCVEDDSSLHVSTCKLEHACISKTTIIGDDFRSRMLQTGGVGSCTVPSKSAPSTNCKSESGCQTSIPKGQLPDIPAEYFKGMNSETTTVHFEKLPENVNDESETVKLIAMTFSMKPPTIDWRGEPEREALKNGGSNVVTSLQGDITDNCLPFFARICPEEEELQGVSLTKCKYIGKQGQVMGVPTLRQRDGSYLFMLTHAVSPPLRESVDRWISCDSSDILRQKINVPSPPLPLYVSSPGEMVDSQGSLADEGNFPLSEPAFLSKEKSDQKKCSMEVKAVNETKKRNSTVGLVDTSQISGPGKNTRLTPLSQIGFRDPASAGQGQQLTLMSVEVQAESRGDLRPDPRFDAINIIVLVLQEDDESTLDTHVLLRCGSVYVEKDLDAVPESRVFAFTEELQLLKHFTKVVHASDPDVLMGWDVQSGSLGFLAERAAHMGVGLLNNISRTPSHINVATGDSGSSEKAKGKVLPESGNVEAVHLEKTVIEDEWGRTHASGVHVGGRIVLNIWRLMRNEVKLNMYTVEAVAETILRQKIPCIPWKALTKWFSSGPGRARYRSIDYTLKRAKLNLQIMNQLDMINRTSELARVFGIDFFSVLSRGSQYRVESMFLRLAHTQNYIAISPGKQQVANQPAMECLPLVMEPESNFYADPVIVLDFQSLYPSMLLDLVDACLVLNSQTV